tara:strand:+ start:317 stop:853 length:537 start_codon:yes stop_codon:yes gene_type:complete
MQGHRGGVMWLTGLPASGKKVLASVLATRLFKDGIEVYTLDSVKIRGSLSSDLGFSRNDRRENIRRAAELAAIMARSGLVVIAAFIAPYAEDRARARSVAENFHEIFLDMPLELCEARDKDDRYTRARKGYVSNFTGISAPYEVPDNPEVTLSLQEIDSGSACDILVEYVKKHFVNFT